MLADWYFPVLLIISLKINEEDLCKQIPICGGLSAYFVNMACRHCASFAHTAEDLLVYGNGKTLNQVQGDDVKKKYDSEKRKDLGGQTFSKRVLSKSVIGGRAPSYPRPQI